MHAAHRLFSASTNAMLTPVLQVKGHPAGAKAIRRGRGRDEYANSWRGVPAVYWLLGSVVQFEELSAQGAAGIISVVHVHIVAARVLADVFDQVCLCSRAPIGGAIFIGS